MVRQFSGLLVSAILVGGIVSGASDTFAQSVPLVPPSNAGSAPTTAPDPVSGVVLENIIINGLQRIEEETVLSYLSVKLGRFYNAPLINKSVKQLYATGLFSDVSVSAAKNGEIIINVVENPIINRVAFEGNLRVDDEILSSEVQLRPRVVYTRTRVQNDVKRILDVYRRRGRYAAKVVPKIIQLDQNRVDLAFEIEEGPDSGVHKISFVGNKAYDDSDLAEELITKQTRWYSFLSDADTYDPDKLTFDRELLRRFYLKNGFADFRVVSSVAELSEDRTGFYITFTLAEGDRYRFNDFEITSELQGVDTEAMFPLIGVETGDWFNANKLEDITDRMTDYLNQNGFPFVDVYPAITRDVENDLVNIVFEISEAEKLYVDRIEIRGNVRTKDDVIRREMALIEGDAFNSSKVRRSRTRISSLGYFKNVKVDNVPGELPGQTVVQIEVEEQSTGELTLGGGYSTTSGALAQIAINERNLMGTGRRLRVATEIAQKETNADISFTEPYFLDRELEGGVDIFFTERDNQDIYSSDNKEVGFGLRLGYDYDDVWSQRLRLRIAEEEVTNVDDDASIYVKAEVGKKSVYTLGQTLIHDKRNKKSSPTEGYFASFANDYSGLGGDVDNFSTTLKAAHYTSFLEEDYILEISGSVSNIFGIDGQDVRLNDRFYAGGANLRGFDSGGIGPRDISTNDALGGKNRWLSTVELQFPTGTPKEFGLKGSVFLDAGSVWDTESSGSNIKDDNSIRSAIGVGFSWASPIGPMRFDFSKSILEETYDDTEVFRFSFGTQF
ncbi:MAG: outer membrane protein assembly factor BamA [Alphaproteobacteria bacterium]|nr:outer membrane protein assembly factor BamA [Alphaproteobacteria bacterium]